MKRFNTDFDDEHKLNYTLSCCNDLVCYKYFNDIKKLQLNLPLTSSCCIQIIEIYPPYNFIDSTLFDCMLSSLHHLGASIGFFIQQLCGETFFYLAIQDSKTLSTSTAIVAQTLSALLSPSSYHILSANACHNMLHRHLFNPSNIDCLVNCTLTSHVQSSNTTSNSSLIATNLTSLLPQDDATLLFLAEPISQESLQSFGEQIGEYSSTLAAFESLTYTVSDSKNDNQKNDCIDDTIDINLTNCTTNKTSNDSCTSNNGINLSTSPTFKKENSPSLNVSGNQSSTNTNTCNQSQNNVSSSEKRLITKSHHSNSNTSTTSTSFSYKLINQVILTMQKEANTLTDDLLSRPHKPLFQCSFYCTSPNTPTALMNTFNFVECASNTPLVLNDYFVTSWTKDEINFNSILKEIKCLRHPRFTTYSGHDAPLSSFISLQGLKYILPLANS